MDVRRRVASGATLDAPPEMSDCVRDFLFHPMTSLALLVSLNRVRNRVCRPCRDLKQVGRLNPGEDHRQENDESSGDDGEVKRVLLSHNVVASDLHEVKTLRFHLIEWDTKLFERDFRGLLHHLRPADEILES